MDNFQTAAGIVALAWIAVFALLQFEHTRWATLDFRIRYLMGMGSICLGCVGAGIALNNLALAIVPGVLATAGLTVLLSYANEAQAEHDKKTAQKQGEIIGMARGIRRDLTQEMIDRGDNPPRHQN